MAVILQEAGRSAYLATLRSAALSAAAPAQLAELWVLELASVEATVASQARALPACHSIIIIIIIIIIVMSLMCCLVETPVIQQW